MDRYTVLGQLLPSSTPFPIFANRVPAGFPSPAQDHLERHISLDELLNLRAPHVYLVEAGGRSLEGIGIFDGDLLIVDRAASAWSGAVVIAALNGEPIVKIFSRLDEQITLRSANPDFAPRYVLEGDDLEIWGVVLYSVRRHGQC